MGPGARGIKQAWTQRSKYFYAKACLNCWAAISGERKPAITFLGMNTVGLLIPTTGLEISCSGDRDQLFLSGYCVVLGRFLAWSMRRSRSTVVLIALLGRKDAPASFAMGRKFFQGCNVGH
ncbi:hypothetical protein N619_01650 [Ectopseudomonas oleovorans]|nr:hypothetical protein N619_01650 [Pseudomonas oleovorans]